MTADTESILNSVKKMLGIEAEYTVFDADIIMHINSVFFVLNQLGVGPEEGFKITDATALWTDFMPESPNVESVKSYVYLKVKMLFDPSLNSAVIDAMNRQIAELEWRLNVQVENANDTDHESGRLP